MSPVIIIWPANGWRDQTISESLLLWLRTRHNARFLLETPQTPTTENSVDEWETLPDIWPGQRIESVLNQSLASIWSMNWKSWISYWCWTTHCQRRTQKNQVTEGGDKAFVLIIDLIVFSVSPSLCVLVPLIGETFERSHICMFLEYHEFSCIISPLSWWHVAYKDVKDILLKGSSPSL